MVKSDEWSLPQVQTLQAYFGFIDKDKKGYIDLHRIEHLLVSQGVNITKRQMESFKKFAKISEE